jgi:hypothetical protein
MAVEIKKVLDAQGWRQERESSTALFYNFAPWIAPQAYLHVIIKPADIATLSEIAGSIKLPQIWQDTLSMQNGAILYSDAITIYGVRAPTALLNRRNVFERAPFSIVDENENLSVKPRERFVAIGGYSYNGTQAVLDRDSGTVLAIPRKSDKALCQWPDTDAWINEELTRLSMLFDRNGRILVSREHTLPNWPSE